MGAVEIVSKDQVPGRHVNRPYLDEQVATNEFIEDNLDEINGVGNDVAARFVLPVEIVMSTKNACITKARRLVVNALTLHEVRDQFVVRVIANPVEKNPDEWVLNGTEIYLYRKID